MKKRLLALVCAMTMIFAMSLNTFAAVSADAGSVAGSSNAGSVAANNVVDAKAEIISAANSIQKLTGAVLDKFAETTTIKSGVEGAKISAVSNETAKAVIAEANKVVGANAFIAAIVDLSVPAGTGKASFTLTCPNVWAGQKVTILHQKADGTFESIKPDKLVNNEVTFTLTSYSPIAIVVDAGAPKTADASFAIMMIAMIALAGTVVFTKKAKLN